MMFAKNLIVVGTILLVTSNGQSIFTGLLGQVNDIMTQTGHSRLLQSSNSTGIQFEIDIWNFTSKFKVGKQNDTVKLVPALNVDYVAINAENCTGCQSTNYKSGSSEWLKPGRGYEYHGESIEFFGRSYGNNMRDSVCLDIPEFFDKCYTSNSSRHLDFFLVTNTSVNTIFTWSDGILGLAPNIRRDDDELLSYGQYLKNFGYIEKNTVTAVFNETLDRHPLVTLGGESRTGLIEMNFNPVLYGDTQLWTTTYQGFESMNASLQFASSARSFMYFEPLLGVSVSVTSNLSEY